MKPNTHLAISSTWVGTPVDLSEGRAVVQLITRTEMCADDAGLVHGGFAFGLGDYAAMLAINDPNVVLGAAETKFLAPVRCGEVMVATAEVLTEQGKKREVECHIAVGDRIVFQGRFTCFVLAQHILST
jgi:acyl-coenzyme A thioesterase PaaI-like protein